MSLTRGCLLVERLLSISLLEHRKYLTHAFMHSDRIASALMADSHSIRARVDKVPLSAEQVEQVVSRWLTQLLKHFSVQKLDKASDQEIADYLAAFTQEGSIDLKCDLQSRELISALRRRVMRLAGAQLDSAFVSMTPDIVDEADVVPICLSVEERQLQGVRYQGEVYRKIEEFQPCHRLQSYCLAQTLRERQIPYVITRSDQRFAVWVNVCALPKLHCFK
ncbi:MAG: hypothetical protein AAF528_08495 [Cyanobacteria bacterium P01_C01_bin.121]